MDSVKFYLGERPVYVFDTRFVPAEHYVSYGAGTSIFDFLNSRLSSTDIDSVRIGSDGVNGFVAIVYRLDEKLKLDMPSFMPMDEDDCPF